MKGDRGMSAQRNILNTLLLEQKQRIHGGIYHRLQIDFAYNSNHIEGSRLTHDQTRFIFETKSIGEPALVNDVFETSNHFRCFDYILQTVREPLTEEYIKSLHGMLKQGVYDAADSAAVIGAYKRYANEVGKITTARPSEVSGQMQRLLKQFAGIEHPDLYDIAAFHAEFERIHPFYDGNGRIGRLLIFKQCLEQQIVPFFISDFNKQFYYQGLSEWQLDGKKQRLLDVFLSAQDDTKQLLDFFEIDYDRTELTARALLQQHEA